MYVRNILGIQHNNIIEFMIMIKDNTYLSESMRNVMYCRRLNNWLAQHMLIIIIVSQPTNSINKLQVKTESHKFNKY